MSTRRARRLRLASAIALLFAGVAALFLTRR